MNQTFSIYHNFEIDAPSQKVFDAIVQPMHLINWWPLQCTGNPKLEASYNFQFGPEYNWFGKVVAYNKNKTFHIKMTKSDNDWNPTTFRFDLEEINNKVQVNFSHVN